MNNTTSEILTNLTTGPSQISPDEFVEWLKGFGDAIGESVPTDKQWKRIRDKLGGIQKFPTISLPPYQPITIDPQPWNPNPIFPNYPPIVYTTTTRDLDQYRVDTGSKQ